MIGKVDIIEVQGPGTARAAGLEKIRLFNAVNVESGYRVLSIRSPREVTTYEGH